jgi:opacity protein-like surface antigen
MKRLNLISLITVAIAILMASGTNAQGQSVDNTKQYSINLGLTAGTDFILSDNFTAGINSTYNLSRSGSSNINAPGVGVINVPISGGNFKFGVNFAYNF